MAYSFAQLEQLARSVGLSPSDARVAAAIATAESRGETGAISATGDYGLWQINARSWPMFDRQRLLQPVYNANAMAYIFRRSGWSPWATYTSGRYRAFLPSSSSSSSSSSSAGALPGIPGLGTVTDAAGNVVDALTGGAGDAIGNVVDALNPASVAQDVVGRVGSLLLGLLLASGGLALAGLGLLRLTSSSETLQTAQQQVQSVAGTAAMAAAL